MTTFERFEREIPRLMDELSPPRLPDYLDDMLRQTARTSQRPAWSALERWLPMGVIARTRTVTGAPWRPILAVVALALLAIVAAVALGIGITRPAPLPAPFGPAANGVILYSTVDGDIVRGDPATGGITPVIGTPDHYDTSPWFANDGTKFLFDRATSMTDAGKAMLVTAANGSDVREIAGPGLPIRWFDWSPDGDRMVVIREGDPIGVITILDAVDGTSTTIDVGVEVDSTAWRPGTDQLIVSGPTSILSVEASNGAGPRTIVDDPDMLSGQFAVSPDGKLLVYTTWSDEAQGRINGIDLLHGGTSASISTRGSRTPTSTRCSHRAAMRCSWSATMTEASSRRSSRSTTARPCRWASTTRAVPAGLA